MAELGECLRSEVHYLGEVANRALWHRRIGAWIATTDVDGSARPGAVKILRVEDDGTIHLFLDRVGARRDEGGPVLLFERAVAETVIHDGTLYLGGADGNLHALTVP